MANFREAVVSSELRDLPFTGYEYTYDNEQEGDDIVQCRLDRALVNDDWIEMFDKAVGVNLDREWSDHASIKIVLSSGRKVRGGGIDPSCSNK